MSAYGECAERERLFLEYADSISALAEVVNRMAELAGDPQRLYKAAGQCHAVEKECAERHRKLMEHVRIHGCTEYP